MYFYEKQVYASERHQSIKNKVADAKESTNYYKKTSS